jgi:hypothetical protein
LRIHKQEQEKPLKTSNLSLLVANWGGIYSVRRLTMMTGASPTQNVANQLPAAIGAMLVWVFFENLGKGLYTPAGYANLINHNSHYGCAVANSARARKSA